MSRLTFRHHDQEWCCSSMILILCCEQWRCGEIVSLGVADIKKGDIARGFVSLSLCQCKPLTTAKATVTTTGGLQEGL